MIKTEPPTSYDDGSFVIQCDSCEKTLRYADLIDHDVLIAEVKQKGWRVDGPIHCPTCVWGFATLKKGHL